MKIKLTVTGVIISVIFLLIALAASGLYAANLPRLLELGSVNCIPCKMMQPILEELRKEYPGKLKVDFVDVWKKPEVAKKYKIMVIPTQIFFDKSGKEIFRHHGYYPKEEILKRFKELGVKL